MKTIAELLEITGEIVVWKDRRNWWIGQVFVGIGLAAMNLALSVFNMINRQWIPFALSIVAVSCGVFVTVKAIRGIKRTDDIIAKLTESAVRL